MNEKEMLQLNENIYKEEMQLLDNIKELEETKEMYNSTETAIYLDLCEEKDALGKPLFSNETKRAVELKNRIALRKDIINEAMRIKDKERALKFAQKRIDFLQRQLRIYLAFQNSKVL